MLLFMLLIKISCTHYAIRTLLGKRCNFEDNVWFCTVLRKYEPLPGFELQKKRVNLTKIRRVEWNTMDNAFMKEGRNNAGKLSMTRDCITGTFFLWFILCLITKGWDSWRNKERRQCLNFKIFVHYPDLSRLRLSSTF